LIFWYAIGIVLFLILTCELYTLKTGVPTVTSFPSVRKKMVEILQKEAAQHNTPSPLHILDLGSGTGKLTLEIGRAIPSAHITGLEISLTPFLLSLLRRWLWRVTNVDYKREDFWRYDLSGVDAVVLFINGKVQERMAKKLKAELPSGALIILNETHLPDWDPIEVLTVGLLKVKIVVYRQT
jgi:SAM-dependent methyltransferase